MIRQPTVFILGAGASSPYGFPTGDTLLRRLIDTSHSAMINEPQPIWLPKDGVEGNELTLYIENQLRFKRQLARANVDSIDEFLREQPELAGTGKNLIAAGLSLHENPDKLFSMPPGNWLREIWRVMQAPPGEFEKNAVTFVTYNYDRSLEHFFTTSIANRYPSVTPPAAWASVQKIPILHPHGMLGPYQPDSAPDFFSSRNQSRSYQAHYSRMDTAMAAKGIRLFWEPSNEHAPMKQQITAALKQARYVVFLGFGFLDSNLEHLWEGLTPFSSRGTWSLFATGKGLRPMRKAGLLEQFKRRGIADNDFLTDADCLSLLTDHVPLRNF